MLLRMARFEVSEADRKVLESWLRMPTLSQELGLRARAVLASAEGETVRVVAYRFKVSPNTVAACRRRFREGGVDALRTKARAGRPPKLTRAQEQAVVAATLRTPKNATHWSARRLAHEVGLPSATVHRIWQKYGLQPHRVQTFKFSTDPEFTTKAGGYSGSVHGPASTRHRAVC
jgi:transposase